MLLFNRGQVADVFPLICDGPQAKPREAGVKLELFKSQSIAFVVDHLGRKTVIRPRFFVRRRVLNEESLLIQCHRLLFIETRGAEWIDPQRVSIQMASNGRRRELRHCNHPQAVFQVDFEGV